MAHLIRRRWLWLAGLIVVTAAFALPAAKVGVDNSVDVWFLEGDDALASYRNFQETFGNDEVVVIGVSVPSGVYQKDVLNRIATLTAKLKKLAGVRRVLSVANAPVVSGGLGEIDVTPAMGETITDAAVPALKTRVESDPMLKGRLVTKNGTVALIYAQMAALKDIDTQRHTILAGLNAVVDTEIRPHYAVHVAGIGVIYDALNEISQKEAGLFMGVAFIAIFGLLWPFFRSLAPVAIAAGAVTAALVITRGLFGLFGHDDNMITLTLPVLIIVLGVAECVHILRHRSAHPDQPPAEALAEIVLPCFYTSITTVVGFGSLATSRVAVVRDFGIFAAIGIALAFVATVIVTAFAFGSPKLKLVAPKNPESGWLERLLLGCSKAAVRHAWLIIGISSVVVLVAGYGMTRIETDTFSLGFLPEGHPVRKDTEALEALIGPFTPLELVVTTTSKEPEAGKEPEVLRGMHAFQKAIEAETGLHIQNTFSVADVAARLHQINGGEGTPFEVPTSAAMVAQDLELYTSDADNESRDLADPSWRRLRITAAVPVLSAKGYQSLIEHVKEIGKRTLPSSVTLEATGYLPLYVKMIDYVVQSQVSSFGWAFVLVFVLMAFLFRSIKLTALAVPPNVYPTFILLGLMGFLGIHLDIATATITSIVTGIIVDDTIHYLHCFRIELARHGGDHAAAAHASALSTGRAVTMSSVLFLVGFSLLMLASVKSIFYFGFLTTFALVIGMFGDAFLLPATLVALRPKLTADNKPPAG